MNAKLRIKMEFSDIITVIVLGVISILTSIIQSKAKGKETPKPVRKAPQSTKSDDEVPETRYIVPETEEESFAPEEEPEEEFTSLEEIFRALREGREPELQPRPRTVVEEVPIIEHHEVEEPPKTHQFVEGERATNEISTGEISDEAIYDGEETSEQYDMSRVDWQQAVVTSEILNRKYT